MKTTKKQLLEEMRQYVDLEDPKGKKVEAKYNEYGKIVQRYSRKGLGYLCSCTGKTEKTATKFKTTEQGLVCPECGKTLKIVKSKGQYSRDVDERLQKDILKEKEAVENVHLELVDKSVSSGWTYYRLSARVEPETWNKIKEFFDYWTYDEDDDEQDTFGGCRLQGWLTVFPEKVEERLNVKPELRLDYRQKEAKKTKEEKERLHGFIDFAFNNVKEEFEDKKPVQPWADETKKGTQGASMINWPEGVEIEDPGKPFDIYGTGRKWVINKKDGKIWEINNNGMDGDNWGLNNVKTGGAGAIGVYVLYSAELEKLIRDYVSLFNR